MNAVYVIVCALTSFWYLLHIESFIFLYTVPYLRCRSLCVCVVKKDLDSRTTTDNRSSFAPTNTATKSKANQVSSSVRTKQICFKSPVSEGERTGLILPTEKHCVLFRGIVDALVGPILHISHWLPHFVGRWSGEKVLCSGFSARLVFTAQSPKSTFFKPQVYFFSIFFH